MTNPRTLSPEELRSEWLLLLGRAKTLRNRVAMAEVELELIRRSWEAETR